MDALSLAGADPTGIPLNDLRMKKTLLSDFQLLIIPGGFSYADALGAGNGMSAAGFGSVVFSRLPRNGRPR